MTKVKNIVKKISIHFVSRINYETNNHSIYAKTKRYS